MSETQLANRLKEAREAVGITMAEAARRLNLSKIGYCRYEYGDRTPSAQTIEVIAQCFGTSVDYLLGNTDDMSPDCIVIRKDDDPELYDLYRVLSNHDSPARKRIIAYYEKMNNRGKSYEEK